MIILQISFSVHMSLSPSQKTPAWPLDDKYYQYQYIYVTSFTDTRSPARAFLKHSTSLLTTVCTIYKLCPIVVQFLVYYLYTTNTVHLQHFNYHKLTKPHTII